MEEGTLHGEASLHSGVHFAAGDQVDGHTLFCHDLINALKAGCLAGEERVAALTQSVLHGVHIQTAIITDAVFIH